MVTDDHNLKMHILSEIQRLSKEGLAPGKERFLKDTRIKEYRIQKLFGGWTKAVTEAGLTPNKFGEEKISHDTLMSALAELTRELGQFPSMPEITFARNKNRNLPSQKTFENLGNKERRLELVLHWANNSAEYRDVAEILSATAAIGPAPQVHPSNAMPESAAASIVLSKSFLPPVVSCLSELAKGSASALAACKEQSIDREFEDRIESAFKILGFAVDTRGPGYRDLDGIAKYKQGHWAIMYDAKKRESGYRLGTDDRQFREYIEKNWKSLQSEGFKKHYFVVISSSFFEDDIKKAHELSRVTTAMPCVLLEADALMCIIEEHLQGNLDHDQIEKLLQTGILTRQKVLDSLPKKSRGFAKS